MHTLKENTHIDQINEAVCVVRNILSLRVIPLAITFTYIKCNDINYITLQNFNNVDLQNKLFFVSL